MTSEHETQVALASLTFVLGTACLSAVLIALSIVPDCAGRLTTQFLTYFVVQSVVHLAVLMATTLTVSVLLAVNASDLATDSIDSVPGHILLAGITVAACLQFTSSFYRLFSNFASVLSLRLFSKTLVFATIMGAFLLGANKFVNNMVVRRTLRFSVPHFRWQFSEPEDERVLQLVIVGAAALLSLLYVIGVAHSFVTNVVCVSGHRRIDRSQLKKDLRSSTLFYLCDIFYAVLLLLTHHRSQPTPPPTHDDFFQSVLHVTEGYVQCFLLPLWPIICAFANYKEVRKAISMRTRLMMEQQQMPSRRRRASSKKMSSVSSPNVVFQFYDIERKLTTATTAPLIEESVANNV